MEEKHTMSLLCIPVYFLQGLSIRGWDHKTCPREGFDLAAAGLKLPVLIIRVGL